MDKEVFHASEKPWQAYGFPPPKSEASKGSLSLADHEIYSGIEVPNAPFVARLDGWSFHALAKKLKFEKPFDRFFINAIAETAKAFFITFNPLFAYCFSDEINLIFKKPTSFKRTEKIDSIFAAAASTNFLMQLQEKYKIDKEVLKYIGFDCRCIPLEKEELIYQYLIWRQAECFRNHNNAWAQYLLIKSGLTPRKAAKQLEGMKTKEIFSFCLSKGVDLNKTEAWQRNGVVVKWKAFEKIGFDPIKKLEVKVLRRAPIIDFNPPLFKSKEGIAYIKNLISQ